MNWLAWAVFVLTAVMFLVGFFGWLYGRREQLRRETREGQNLMMQSVFVAAIWLLVLWLPCLFEAGNCERAVKKFAGAWANGEEGAMNAMLDKRADFPDVVTRHLAAVPKMAFAFDDMPWVRSWEQDIVKARVYTGTVAMAGHTLAGKEFWFDVEVSVWVAKDSCRVCAVHAMRK